MSEAHFEGEGPESDLWERLNPASASSIKSTVAHQKEWIANSDRIRSLWKAEAASAIRNQQSATGGRD